MKQIRGLVLGLEGVNSVTNRFNGLEFVLRLKLLQLVFGAQNGEDVL